LSFNKGKPSLPLGKTKQQTDEPQAHQQHHRIFFVFVNHHKDNFIVYIKGTPAEKRSSQTSDGSSLQL